MDQGSFLTRLFASASIVLPPQWTPRKAPSDKNRRGPHCKKHFDDLETSNFIVCFRDTSQVPSLLWISKDIQMNFYVEPTRLKIDEEIVSIFPSRDQRPLNNLSRCLKSHLSICRNCFRQIKQSAFRNTICEATRIQNV